MITGDGVTVLTYDLRGHGVAALLLVGTFLCVWKRLQRVVHALRANSASPLHALCGVCVCVCVRVCVRVNPEQDSTDAYGGDSWRGPDQSGTADPQWDQVHHRLPSFVFVYIFVFA